MGLYSEFGCVIPLPYFVQQNLHAAIRVGRADEIVSCSDKNGEKARRGSMSQILRSRSARLDILYLLAVWSGPSALISFGSVSPGDGL